MRPYFLTFHVIVYTFRVSGRRTNHVTNNNRVDILNLSYFNFLHSVVPRLTSVPWVRAVTSTTLTQQSGLVSELKTLVSFARAHGSFLR